MFFDRYDAGRRLAGRLKKYKHEDVVVYALPPGGLLTGFEVSKALGAPLDIVLTQKVKHPFYPEYAICAVNESGYRVCDDYGLCGVDIGWVEEESKMMVQATQQTRQTYMNGRPATTVSNKVVILVDDGIETGLSMKAAIQAIKSECPEQIIVAVPVAPREIIAELTQLVDDVVVVKEESRFRGRIANYYTQFPEIQTQEALACLELSRLDMQEKHKSLTQSYQQSVFKWS